MKSKILSAAIALPLALALTSCEAKKPETTEDKMSAGADKVAEGVKEMTDAAASSAKEAEEKAKAAGEKAVEDAKEAVSGAADAAADAASDAAKAAADAAKAAKDAADAAAPGHVQCVAQSGRLWPFHGGRPEPEGNVPGDALAGPTVPVVRQFRLVRPAEQDLPHRTRGGLDAAANLDRRQPPPRAGMTHMPDPQAQAGHAKCCRLFHHVG